MGQASTSTPPRAAADFAAASWAVATRTLSAFFAFVTAASVAFAFSAGVGGQVLHELQLEIGMDGLFAKPCDAPLPYRPRTA